MKPPLTELLPMTTTLAQLSPEMLKGLPAWLVSAGALLWIANELFKLARNLKSPEPQPPNEQLELSHGALEQRVDSIEDDLRGIRDELKEDRADNEKHASARSASIYRRIDEVEQRLGDKIDGIQKDMPSQLIVMLKNTGAI